MTVDATDMTDAADTTGSAHPADSADSADAPGPSRNPETTDTDFHNLGFIQFLGVEGRDHADGRTVVAIAPHRRHLNHNGDLHAAVLFGVAETAGVGAAVSGVMDLLATSFVVVRDARVEFLARARGDVAEFTATGTVDPDEYAKGCRAARNGEPTELVSVAEVADPNRQGVLARHLHHRRPPQEGRRVVPGVPGTIHRVPVAPSTERLTPRGPV